jgi:formylglycine-generating enzyme required for sulfatase activity
MAVAVPARVARYRAAGEFQRNGLVVDAPRVEATRTAPLLIMALQVGAADYQRCVADGACRPPADSATGRLPVTGVSYADAVAYAGWLSRATGQFWRLPTDVEWSFAAGSRFADDALGLAADARDPSRRWRAAYALESSRSVGAVSKVEPAGSFGRNEFGVVDLAGSVWEWTSTCYDRTRLDARDAVQGVMQNCNVRVAEGRHRAYLTAFIRDARGGGCGGGRPPDHHGFRLVREASPLPLVERLTGWWAYRQTSAG